MFKHTKIGATVGPSCADQLVLEKMVKAGMNFARLNFAHGTHESNGALLKTIRAVEEKTGEPIAILQDLQGPRIRIGVMPDDGVAIKDGESVILNTALTAYAGGDWPVDHPELHRFIKPGERILIDDGRVELEVTNVTGTQVTGSATQGGVVKSHKGINLPDSALTIPALSEKDRSDLRFAVKNEVDMVGLSFVSSAKDILDVRFLIQQYLKEENLTRKQPIFIIAKIERRVAVENLSEILDVADGIMVARGDLGLELPAAQVPLVQKRIIDAANALAKPVIVATQMLNSMQTSRRPTRAEVSDVANAVIDHADALLLTNETASGEFPVLAVETMADIAVTTERSSYDDTDLPIHHKGTPLDSAIADMSRLLADELNAKLILAASISGETGRLISHVRPLLPILVATATPASWRQLNLSWGVKPFMMLPCQSIEELVERSINYIKQQKLAKKGDTMIIVAGEPVGQAGHVNLVEVREIT
ncbi:MAG: Pyruvate kinase [Parcubacteria group bacterium GW2011_GWA2_53_21]|nr:MAG: Pyruvate kinase [Parcubacteria group bacterium GW2011_GWA2_53_21]